MGNFKGTKGPWVNTTTPSGKSKVAELNGFSICTMPSGTKQDKANCQLIATAPELLEALQGLLSFAEQYNMDNHWTDNAKAAINKALTP